MDNQTRSAHLVGSGIGNLAAAAYLIKDGGFAGANIIDLRGGDRSPGGALDAAGVPEHGYVMRGERMYGTELRLLV